MPFGLKNARVTYQGMMTRMFELQLRKSIEVYVDDMVVKSKVVSEHVGDLGNVFKILRKHKLHLNASKCSFGVGFGKFLGFMVTHRGIEVNPDQVKAINSLQPPRNPKEFKEYLSQPPVMSRPEVDEVLFAYIAVASHALPLEKAILAVVHATRKLPYYFQSYTVVVLTQLLLRSLLRSAYYTGRIAKWGTILGAFDIKYMSRTSVKGQVLADLVAEFTKPLLEENTKKLDMDEKSVGMISLKESLSWKVYVDVALNQRGSRVGLVVISSDKIVIEKSLRMDFSVMNNETEYETLLVGMTMVQKMGGKTMEMFSNSRLVVGQVEGELEARDSRMQEYLSQGNGQAEAVNKVIVNGLKKRLDDAKGKWVEELSHILWTYRTTPCRSIGETPFSMTYGAEAVIPLETGFPTLKTSSFTPSNNDGLLERSLDLVDERRENVMVQLAYYQHKLKQGYDLTVKLRPLELGDLVLGKVLGTAKNPAWGKLRPNWERSYSQGF
ncbi:uncharacterized protein LOC142608876 [Castanea sativa]|uniref:uncharacterized protein LOC142608876 n=1 Tax=Castanea sativa TaxID=21020 RepID=UPI003F651B1D